MASAEGAMVKDRVVVGYQKGRKSAENSTQHAVAPLCVQTVAYKSLTGYQLTCGDSIYGWTYLELLSTLFTFRPMTRIFFRPTGSVHHENRRRIAPFDPFPIRTGETPKL